MIVVDCLLLEPGFLGSGLAGVLATVAGLAAWELAGKVSFDLVKRGEKARLLEMDSETGDCRGSGPVDSESKLLSRCRRSRLECRLGMRS